MTSRVAPGAQGYMHRLDPIDLWQDAVVLDALIYLLFIVIY